MPFTIRPSRRFSCARPAPVKRLLLVTLLVLGSGPAYAEWVLLGPSESKGGYSVYVDPDTIRRKSEMVKMWYLADFETPQAVRGVSYLSQKAQGQFDCAEERWRQLAFTNFSGHMGRGDAVFSNIDEDNWAPVQPGSVGEGLWETACNKK